MSSDPTSTTQSQPLSAAQLSRLRWHCRRGMRELDVLFMKYFDQLYPGASRQEQQAFEDLLEFQDPVILTYLTGKDVPDRRDIADVIERLTRIGG